MITWFFALFVYAGLCHGHPNSRHSNKTDLWKKEPNGKLYMINPKQLAWSDANHECEIRSGKLLTIEDDHIQKIAKNIVKGEKLTKYWIGLVEDLFKHWTWEGGVGNPKYMNWESGQPSSGSLGGCAVMNSHGQWRVSDCEVTRESICQREDDEGLVDVDSEELVQSKENEQADDKPSNTDNGKQQGEAHNRTPTITEREHETHKDETNQRSVSPATPSQIATKKSKTQFPTMKGETTPHSRKLTENKTNESPLLTNKTSEVRNETKLSNQAQNIHNETLTNNRTSEIYNMTSNVTTNDGFVDRNMMTNHKTDANITKNVTSASQFGHDANITNNVTSASQFHHVGIDEIQPLPEDKLYQRNNAELLKEWLTDFRKDELQDTSDNSSKDFVSKEKPTTELMNDKTSSRLSKQRTDEKARRKDYLCDTPNGYRHQSGLCDLTRDPVASHDNNNNNNNQPTSSSQRKNQVKHAYNDTSAEIDELLGVVLENEGLSESDQKLILGSQQTTPSVTTMKMKLDEGSSLNEAEDQMFGKEYRNSMKNDAPTPKIHQRKAFEEEPTISYTSKTLLEPNKQKNNSNADVFALDKVTMPTTAYNASRSPIMPITASTSSNIDPSNATVENKTNTTVENKTNATVENKTNATVENKTNATVENKTISIKRNNNTMLGNQTVDATTRTDENSVQENSGGNTPTQSGSQTKEVKTFGGNSGGEPCIFPFVYQEETFFQCVTDKRSHPWCATTSSYDKMPLWGYCCKGTKCPSKLPTKPSLLYQLYTALTTQRMNNSAHVATEQNKTKDNSVQVNPFMHTTAHVLHKAGEEHLSIHSGLKTYGGNAAGARCVIPFVQDGHTHMKCIQRDDNTSWCAITHNYDKIPLWGNCCDRDHCEEMY